MAELKKQFVNSKPRAVLAEVFIYKLNAMNGIFLLIRTMDHAWTYLY